MLRCASRVEFRRELRDRTKDGLGTHPRDRDRGLSTLREILRKEGCKGGQVDSSPRSFFLSLDKSVRVKVDNRQ